MGCNQPDDPLDLGRIELHVRVDTALAEDIDAQRAVGIDHNLDHPRVGERGGNRRPHRGAQHRAAALRRNTFGLGGHHDVAPSDSTGASVRLPPAIWRPTCETNASNRSRPIARAAASASGIRLVKSVVGAAHLIGPVVAARLWAVGILARRQHRCGCHARGEVVIAKIAQLARPDRR